MVLAKEASALLLYYSACIIVISTNSYIYITFGSSFKSKWLKVHPRFTFIRLCFPWGSDLWTWCYFHNALPVQIFWQMIKWEKKPYVLTLEKGSEPYKGQNLFLTLLSATWTSHSHLDSQPTKGPSYKKLARFLSNALFTYFYIYFALQIIRFVKS